MIYLQFENKSINLHPNHQEFENREFDSLKKIFFFILKFIKLRYSKLEKYMENY